MSNYYITSNSDYVSYGLHYFFMIIPSLILLLLLLLILCQFKYISSNTTTSEYLKRREHNIPILDTESCIKNWELFCLSDTNKEKYEGLEYNSSILKYLEQNIPIQDLIISSRKGSQTEFLKI